jgi:RNA polymerase sigma factor (TIGR02999 family)
MNPIGRDVTQLLIGWNRGDAAARDELMTLVHHELRRVARAYLHRERPDHTLQPTALVHEAYLRLIDQSQVNWQNRSHFFGIAARLMRQILVNHAEAHNAAKRGGSQNRLTLSAAERGIDAAGKEDEVVDLVDLHEALKSLEQLDSEQSRIVELRFFAGLTFEEIAEVLDISVSAVKREWTTARAWLRHELHVARQ